MDNVCSSINQLNQKHNMGINCTACSNVCAYSIYPFIFNTQSDIFHRNHINCIFKSFSNITKNHFLLAITCTDERIRIRAEMCTAWVNRADGWSAAVGSPNTNKGLKRSGCFCESLSLQGTNVLINTETSDRERESERERERERGEREMRREGERRERREREI